MRRLSGCLVVAVLCACGSDSDPNSNNQNSLNNANSIPGDDCFFSIAVIGEVEESWNYGIQEGCGGGSSGADMTAGGGFGIIGTDWNFQYQLRQIEPGQRGQFEATVRIRDLVDDRTWVQENCSASVEIHDYLRESVVGTTYRLEGDGTCPPNGAIAEDDSVLSIGFFNFRNETLWVIP